jgi:hypothetical protein
MVSVLWTYAAAVVALALTALLPRELPLHLKAHPLLWDLDLLPLQKLLRHQQMAPALRMKKIVLLCHMIGLTEKATIVQYTLGNSCAMGMVDQVLAGTRHGAAYVTSVLMA